MKAQRNSNGPASAPTGPNWAVSIMPYAELGNIYDKLNLTISTGLKNAVNAPIEQIPVSLFICPSDPAGASPIMTRFAAHNQSPAMALWYAACMGPTHMDSCPFCPNGTPAANNYCCQGWNFGTGAGGGFPAGTFAGIFGRTDVINIKIANVTDGLSNTFLVGETLPKGCTFMGLYSQNFPLSGTSIPLNIMEEAVDTNWFRTCGYKSLHPAVVNFAMGDGSVRGITASIDYRVYNELGTRAGGESTQLPN